jgi:hypothetical protein
MHSIALVEARNLREKAAQHLSLYNDFVFCNKTRQRRRNAIKNNKRVRKKRFFTPLPDEAKAKKEIAEIRRHKVYALFEVIARYTHTHAQVYLKLQNHINCGNPETTRAKGNQRKRNDKKGQNGKRHDERAIYVVLA